MNVPLRHGIGLRCAVALVAGLLASGQPGETEAASLLPLVTESAAILPSGSAEVVLGASYFKDRRFPEFTPAGALRSQDLIMVPQLGLRIAAGSWAEIQATFEFINVDETTADCDERSNFGNGDARLFSKVRLLRESDRQPALGVRFGTKLPNAKKDNRLGTDETDFAIETLVSKDFGFLAAHVNVGISLLGNPGPVLGDPERKGSGQDDLLSYSAAFVSRDFRAQNEAAWALRVAAEVSGLTGSRFDNDRAVLRTGLQIRRGRLTVYSGLSAGLTAGAEDFGVMGGLLYTFELERPSGRRE